MRWSKLISSLLFWLIALNVVAEDLYKQRMEQLQEHWLQLIPNIATVQYAGNIGLLSAGIGWDYGKHDRWETHMQVAFLPKYHSQKASATFTLKENLIPWSLGLGKRNWARPNGITDILSNRQLDWNRRALFSFEPAVFSLFMNTIFDNEFWVAEPKKYNGGDYYRFSSKIRTHIGVGSRLSINAPSKWRKRYERVSLYYELSTYDLAIITAIPNKKIELGDILRLGIGLQYKFF